MATEIYTIEDEGFESSGAMFLNQGVGHELDSSSSLHGLFFSDILLRPQEIFQAVLTIQEIADDSGEPILYFDAGPRPEAIAATANNLSNRSFTTIGLSAGNFTPVTGVIDIDVTAQIQEIINTPGWVVGSRIVAIFLGQGPARDGWQLNPSYVGQQLKITHSVGWPIICEPLTQEFVDLAIELIDESILTPNATWVSVSENTVADSSKPYEVGLPTRSETSVKILFTQDDLEDRQFFKYRKETALVNGQINAYMYPYAEFTPKMKDVVIWNGKELTIAAIDPIQPIDCPILYFIEFKS